MLTVNYCDVQSNYSFCFLCVKRIVQPSNSDTVIGDFLSCLSWVNICLIAIAFATMTTTAQETDLPSQVVHDDSDEMGSDDEALLEMLGLTSMKEIAVVNDESGADDNIAVNGIDPLPSLSDSLLQSLKDRLHNEYTEQSVCIFPTECSVSAEHMRRLTEELVWGGPSMQVDRTYETIKVWKNGEIEDRRTLTRLENFVDAHPGWTDLCHNYLRRILSAALGVEMVLYKEKLNLKPPGGSGFAPHLDTPSLRVALGPEGPQAFCTVMVAIDDATSQNGCLRICRGQWTEENAINVVQPDEDGNPDGGGRAGAIPLDVSENLHFDDITCKGGTVVAFNGWAPHRSAANVSPFPRRAVFLTYNPKNEGDFHKKYYERMEQLRREWRGKVGLANRQMLEDEELEQSALSTIPKI
jgi:hypothetical protein